MKRYNPKDIEPKWQRAWADSKIYEASDTTDKQKKYILEYFPYPSGAAMHVGHVRNYTIGDALARFARMGGYNVLHPMGWDAFGLPAENYAIKTGISPQEAITQNTAKFKQQLIQMGFSYDWSREFASSDPEYYRWTQWLFLLLFKRGLAYQKESLQWWCPFDKTVLANEQVEAGLCWRCGHRVEKKALKQWFFKITEYADRLEKDLDDVDWSDALKSMQRNWIGRSKGAEIDFKIADTDKVLTVFTTRPDTLYGATFMVVAPEHPIITEIVSAQQKPAVETYVKQAQAKSDIERQETNREKTGVFTGAYAINPVTKQRIPIWVADYVLYGYGTGVIMAVPAHDERDYAFARKFKLSITEVVAPEFGEKRDNEQWADGVTVIGYDKTTDKFLGLDWTSGWTGLIGGGLKEGESYEQCARREIAEEAGITDIASLVQLGSPVFAHYVHAAKGLNRVAKTQAFLAVVEDRQGQETHKEPHETFTNGWYSYDELQQKLAAREGTDHWRVLLARASLDAQKAKKPYDGVALYTDEGVMINSGPYDGMPSSQARERIVADLQADKAGKEVVNYKLRDWLISRQRYWGAPIPIIHCPKDGAVAVPDDQLPVILPEMKSFEPSGDGRSPLARVPEFVQTTCPTCGGPAERETDTMDGFACSSWYFWRFIDPHNDKEPFASDKVHYWAPVDDYIGGAEHAVMHLLYVRFWTKVMFDAGMLEFSEPIKSLRNHGMILAPDGRKMSKSWGNVIAPDDIIAQGYGADAIRIMELFIGPWNQAANWSVEGMGGCFRFLQRIWTLHQEFIENKSSQQAVAPDKQATELRRITNKTVKKVTADLEHMGFNTAIASMMEMVNELHRIKADGGYADREAWQDALGKLTQILAPFAPHITEELWHSMGNESSIHTSGWPAYDEKYLVSDIMTIVVQVNGKLRGQVEVPAGTSQEQVVATALSDAKVATHLNGAAPKKTIYVPDKLINFVV